MAANSPKARQLASSKQLLLDALGGQDLSALDNPAESTCTAAERALWQNKLNKSSSTRLSTVAEHQVLSSSSGGPISMHDLGLAPAGGVHRHGSSPRVDHSGRRVALDGNAYTWREFHVFYQDHAQLEWDAAPPEPPDRTVAAEAFLTTQSSPVPLISTPVAFHTPQEVDQRPASPPAAARSAVSPPAAARGAPRAAAARSAVSPPAAARNALLSARGTARSTLSSSPPTASRALSPTGAAVTNALLSIKAIKEVREEWMQQCEQWDSAAVVSPRQRSNSIEQLVQHSPMRPLCDQSMGLMQKLDAYLGDDSSCSKQRSSPHSSAVQPVGAVFGLLDTNHDGVVDQAEFERGVAGGLVHMGLEQQRADARLAHAQCMECLGVEEAKATHYARRLQDDGVEADEVTDAVDTVVEPPCTTATSDEVMQQEREAQLAEAVHPALTSPSAAASLSLLRGTATAAEREQALSASQKEQWRQAAEHRRQPQLGHSSSEHWAELDRLAADKELLEQEVAEKAMLMAELEHASKEMVRAQEAANLLALMEQQSELEQLRNEAASRQLTPNTTTEQKDEALPEVHQRSLAEETHADTMPAADDIEGHLERLWQAQSAAQQEQAAEYSASDLPEDMNSTQPTATPENAAAGKRADEALTQQAEGATQVSLQEVAASEDRAASVAAEQGILETRRHASLAAGAAAEALEEAVVSGDPAAIAVSERLDGHRRKHATKLALLEQRELLMKQSAVDFEARQERERKQIEAELAHCKQAEQLKRKADATQMHQLTLKRQADKFKLLQQVHETEFREVQSQALVLTPAARAHKARIAVMEAARVESLRLVDEHDEVQKRAKSVSCAEVEEQRRRKVAELRKAEDLAEERKQQVLLQKLENDRLKAQAVGWSEHWATMRGAVELQLQTELRVLADDEAVRSKRIRGMQEERDEEGRKQQLLLSRLRESEQERKRAADSSEREQDKARAEELAALGRVVEMHEGAQAVAHRQIEEERENQRLAALQRVQDDEEEYQRRLLDRSTEEARALEQQLQQQHTIEQEALQSAIEYQALKDEAAAKRQAAARAQQQGLIDHVEKTEQQRALLIKRRADDFEIVQARIKMESGIQRIDRVLQSQITNDISRQQQQQARDEEEEEEARKQVLLLGEIESQTIRIAESVVAPPHQARAMGPRRELTKQEIESELQMHTDAESKRLTEQQDEEEKQIALLLRLEQREVARLELQRERDAVHETQAAARKQAADEAAAAVKQAADEAAAVKQAAAAAAVRQAAASRNIEEERHQRKLELLSQEKEEEKQRRQENLLQKLTENHEVEAALARQEAVMRRLAEEKSQTDARAAVSQAEMKAMAKATEAKAMAKAHAAAKSKAKATEEEAAKAEDEATADAAWQRADADAANRARVKPKELVSIAAPPIRATSPNGRRRPERAAKSPERAAKKPSAVTATAGTGTVKATTRKSGIVRTGAVTQESVAAPVGEAARSALSSTAVPLPRATSPNGCRRPERVRADSRSSQRQSRGGSSMSQGTQKDTRERVSQRGDQAGGQQRGDQANGLKQYAATEELMMQAADGALPLQVTDDALIQQSAEIDELMQQTVDVQQLMEQTGLLSLSTKMDRFLEVHSPSTSPRSVRQRQAASSAIPLEPQLRSIGFVEDQHRMSQQHGSPTKEHTAEKEGLIRQLLQRELDKRV